MRLYATVKSERASKGQGGNTNLVIELKAFDRLNPIGEIILEVMEDSDGNLNQYLLTWKDPDMENSMILREGHEKEGVIQYAEIQDRKRLTEETKGEKQKDECNYATEDTNYCDTHNVEH